MVYTDALRGYAHPVHSRDGFRCVYCGWDGRRWPNWLYLSWDHLVPKGHPLRDDERYIVTACRICNEFHNRTVFDVEGLAPEELVELKRTAIMDRRSDYEAFWRQHVESPSVDQRYAQRVAEGMGWVDKLVSAEAVAIDSALRSRLPEVPGIYAFSRIGQATSVVRAGRTKGAGGLRQRIYQNHLMGNQSGNLRAQLVREGWCASLNEAKEWIRSNCEVRFAIVDDTDDLWWIEHFVLAIIRPEFSD